MCLLWFWDMPTTLSSFFYGCGAQVCIFEEEFQAGLFGYLQTELLEQAAIKKARCEQARYICDHKYYIKPECFDHFRFRAILIALARVSLQLSCHRLQRCWRYRSTPHFACMSVYGLPSFSGGVHSKIPLRSAHIKDSGSLRHDGIRPAET